MKSFPWDSLVEGIDEETGYPIYDRPYDAQDFRSVLKQFFSNGIFSNDPVGFEVRANTGMSVTIGGGSCFINGTTGIENNTTTLMLEAADSSNPRIDTVVLRWDSDLDVRSINLQVVTGIPSSTPKRPELARNTDTVWELGICDILVPAGSVTISDNRITDTRLETSRCGIVAPFAEFDSTSFFERINVLLESLESQNDDLVAAENQRKKNESQRIANEAERKTSENTRETNEKTRQSNETTRKSNETTRQTNENTRISNENSRKTAESNRSTKWDEILTEWEKIKNSEIDISTVTNTQIDNVVTGNNPQSDKYLLSLTGMSYWWGFIKEQAGDKVDVISSEEVEEAFTYNGVSINDIISEINQ